jgi:hypothetical protein
MPITPERGGCRFAVTKTDEDKQLITLEFFHDTVSSLKALTLGFEMLSGTTLEQARTLAEAMNERILGVIVAPK